MTAMVSDGVVIAAVSSTGGLLAATVTSVFAWLAHRQTREVKAIAQETHHQVAINGHSSEKPTMPDRIGDVGAAVAEVGEQVSEVQRSLANHVVMGKQVVGDLRNQITRLTRDFERHQASHTDIPSQQERDQ